MKNGWNSKRSPRYNIWEEFPVQLLEEFLVKLLEEFTPEFLEEIPMKLQD